MTWLRDGYFHIALLSTLEQTHSAFFAYDSKRMTSFFITRFEYPTKWCTYKLQHCLVVSWLVPYETSAMFSVHLYC